MQKCPVCAHMNQLGELICVNCGANLQTGAPVVNMESIQPKGAAPAKAEELSQPTSTAAPSLPTEISKQPLVEAKADESTGAPDSQPKDKDIASSQPAAKAEPDKPSEEKPTEASSEKLAIEDKPEQAGLTVVKAETTTKKVVPDELSAEVDGYRKTGVATGKIECSNCHHMNRMGEVFCESCGINLRTGQRASSTKSLPAEERKQYDVPFEEPAVPERGSDVFPTGGALRLQIEGSSEPILLPFHQQEIVLGRRDPATGALPDVDLTPFAGYRMGVSRRHSQIRRSHDGHLELFDLGSSNGTFLNGQRLEAHYPYRLRDGDKISLGQINILVHFEHSMSSQRQL